MKHIINTNKKPFIPYKGWKVEEHINNGKVDVSKIQLFLSDEQKNGYIEGHKLREILKSKNPLNANVLDYLYEHQDLIPEAWTGKYIYFWGTIYRDSDGDLCVRYLYWHVGVWGRDYGWLDHDWYGHNPAALLASPEILVPNTSSDSHSSDLPDILEINGQKYKKI